MDETPEKIRDYRDLIVWQEAMDIAEAIYVVTRGFRARKCMEWQLRCGDARLLYRRILRKGSAELSGDRSFNSFVSRKAL